MLRIRTLQGLSTFSFNHSLLTSLYQRIVLRGGSGRETGDKSGEGSYEAKDGFNWDGKSSPEGAADANSVVPKFTRYPSLGSPSHATAPFYFNIG